MEEKRAFQGYSVREGVPPPAPMQQPDEQLMRLAQRGDAEAVSALYTRYRRKLLNYLYRLTGDRATAEDLTQETFLRVVRHLPSYRPTGSVGGWIFRIAKNLALNSFRDRKAQKEVPLEEPETDSGEGEMKESKIPHSGPGPDREAGSRETERQIQQALLQLPPVFREALILCDIQGHAYKEAAQMLECSINTIASRLARARSKMAELLGYLKKDLL